MRNKKLKKTVLSAMFLSIGMILPFFTSQIKEIGDSLLPMHIPVMLCGLVCGPLSGLMVGLVLPVLRSLLFSMPPLYPASVWMACELGTYGFVIGLLYSFRGNKKIWYLYLSLIVSMLSGRIVWGIVKTLLLGIGGKAFGFEAFLIGGFIDAIPGIILQLVLIPLIMSLIKEKQI